ncbi:hypothetical protein KI809_18765 [Geobacter pelophilus]|uniref:Uncharacterized protein n=1 Tax=Geoanaerobacter pelophilus TaxID=60036 RepID=A0AAW4LCS3_9BACT|nr:hypothetical protein [Geoanaerobacter pelophilus]MBT0666355.1 hypothetical protein [Geoanaerobacter pelophilus]
MKAWRELIFLAVFLPLCAVWAYAAGVVVPNIVRPGGNFPVVDSSEVKGGPIFVRYSSDLRNIPESRKTRWMQVHVHELNEWFEAYSTNGHFWQRRPGTGGGGVTSHPALSNRDLPNQHPTSAITGLDNLLSQAKTKAEFDSWTANFRRSVPLGRRGYDGRDAPSPLECIIFNEGNDGASYDETGGNPTPQTIGPLSIWAYEHSTLKQITGASWTIPAVDTQLVPPPLELDGQQQKRQVLELSILPRYSSQRTNNKVKGFAWITSSRYPYKRNCSASYTFAFTQRGPIGQKGDPGDITQLTRDEIVAKIAQPSNNPVTVRPATPGLQTLLDFQNYSGNTVAWVDSLGYLNFMAANGFPIARIQTDGLIALLYNNMMRLRMKNDGSITSYNSNGTTAWSLSNTAVPIVDPGAVAVDGLCLKKRINNTYFFENCATGVVATAAGSLNYVQYRGSDGYLAAKSNLMFDPVTNTLTLTGPMVIK